MRVKSVYGGCAECDGCMTCQAPRRAKPNWDDIDEDWFRDEDDFDEEDDER